MKSGNRWFHWICRDCETFNHNSRNSCLSCGELRKNVQITNQKKLDRLYFLWNGREVRKNKGFNLE